MTNPINAIATDQAVLGKVIAVLRRRHVPPIQQKELAAKMEMEPPAWSRVENGETSLSASQLRLVAQNLSVSPATILEKAEQMEAVLNKRGVTVKTIAEIKKEAKKAKEDKKDVGLRMPPFIGVAAAISPVALAATTGYGLYKLFDGLIQLKGRTLEDLIDALFDAPQTEE